MSRETAIQAVIALALANETDRFLQMAMIMTSLQALLALGVKEPEIAAALATAEYMDFPPDVLRKLAEMATPNAG
jgi:hypothetical protein